MSKSASTIDLQERLAIAERAIADSAARIAELTQALGEIARISDEDISRSGAIAIGADTVSPFCIGFYQREYDAADRPYRWTGRGSLFELRFPVNRSFGWDFSLELQHNPHVDIGRLRGYVDYLEIPLDFTVSDGIVRGIIPPRPFGRQAVVTFLLPNLFVPNQINPESTDTRTLGLVFYELRATPTLMNDERTLNPLEGVVPEPGSTSASASGLEAHREGPARRARTSLAATAARPEMLTKELAEPGPRRPRRETQE